MGALTPEEVHGAALLGDRYEAHLALLSSDPTRGRDAELAHSRGELLAAGRECLYLGLPTIGSDTAAVLRQAARQGFLGDPLLVIGPEALIAYGLAAGSRIGQAFPAGAPLELLDGPEDADTAAFDVLMTFCGGPYRASRGRAGPVRNPAGHEVRLHRPDPGTEPEGGEMASRRPDRRPRRGLRRGDPCPDRRAGPADLRPAQALAGPADGP